MDTMQASIKAFPAGPDVRGLVEGAFTCFKLTQETAQPGFKVVFDCQGSVDGKPVPATYGRFQEGIVGNGSLLPEFEKHLCQMAQGGDQAVLTCSSLRHTGKALSPARLRRFAFMCTVSWHR